MEEEPEQRNKSNSASDCELLDSAAVWSLQRVSLFLVHLCLLWHCADSLVTLCCELPVRC
jgi:hypothetical protein